MQLPHPIGRVAPREGAAAVGTPEERADAWTASALTANANSITLVQISSDYVYDGTNPGLYTEDDPVSPLGRHRQSKSAEDAAVTTVPRPYIIRTSWVIGERTNSSALWSRW